MTNTTESHTRLRITINEEPFTVSGSRQEAATLLNLAGTDPVQFDLARVAANGQRHLYRDNQIVEVTDGERFTAVVTVLVNEQSVWLTDQSQTGESIKAAAIAAGVPIQADFVLSEVLPNGKEKVVPDDKHIEVKHLDEFWGIPGDDNS